MIDFLKSWAINITTLVILIVLLEMIVPGGKLKKVVSLVAGFILIIAIINPVLTLLKKGGELKDIQITQTAFLEQKELEASAEKMTKKQSAMVLSNYKSKLIQDIEDNTRSLDKISEVKAEVTVEENPDSKDFGMIKKITVNVKQSSGNSTAAKQVSAIKKIVIDKNDKTSSTGDEAVPQEISSEVKSKLCKLYNISSEQIVVGGL